MNSQRNRRFVALAIAVLGSAVLQACSVATGQWAPSTVHQPASQRDMLHYRSSAMSYHLASTPSGPGELFDYHYY